MLDREDELVMLVAEVQRGDGELQHSRDENQLLLEQNRLLREKLERLEISERLEMEQSTITFPRVRERERTPTGSICDDGISANGHTRGERPISPLFAHQRGPSVSAREWETVPEEVEHRGEWEKTSTGIRIPTQSRLPLPRQAEKPQQIMEGQVFDVTRVITPTRSNHPRSLEERSRTTRTVTHERKPSEPNSVNTTHSKPHIIPDRFDGKTPWNEYIGHFEACRMANAWDDAQAKVFLADSLRGHALKKISNSSSLSYHELVGLLENRFGPGQLAENYLLELRYRRQGPRETIQELGQAVRELSMLAYPELAEEAQDRLARNHFTEAIEDQSVREGVFRSKPTSLDEAIQPALATDNFYRLEEQRTGRRYKQSRVLEGNSSTELDELRQELKWIRERLEGQEKASGEWSGRPRWSTPKTELKCYKCHERGISNETARKRLGTRKLHSRRRIWKMGNSRLRGPREGWVRTRGQ